VGRLRRPTIQTLGFIMDEFAEKKIDLSEFYAQSTFTCIAEREALKSYLK
jgi:hypothetical protein